MITENGIATSKDVKRVRYLFNHMLEVKEAIDDGYDVRGYFVWTLVDNYEWHHGYKAPFGLSRMDPFNETAPPAPIRALLQRHHRNVEGSLDAKNLKTRFLQDFRALSNAKLPLAPRRSRRNLIV